MSPGFLSALVQHFGRSDRTTGGLRRSVITPRPSHIQCVRLLMVALIVPLHRHWEAVRGNGAGGCFVLEPSH